MIIRKLVVKLSPLVLPWDLCVLPIFSVIFPGPLSSPEEQLESAPEEHMQASTIGLVGKIISQKPLNKQMVHTTLQNAWSLIVIRFDGNKIILI